MYLQDVLARLDKAYQAFFERIKRVRSPAFPRFQGRNRCHPSPTRSTATAAHGWTTATGPAKIGRIASTGNALSRARIETVTISQGGRRLVRRASPALRCPCSPCRITGKETGIDVGLKVFLVTAEGDVVENPRHYRRAERELKKAQRRVSRRKKGSKRRRKAVQLLARKHRRSSVTRETSTTRRRSTGTAIRHDLSGRLAGG